jgi:hypothetical protein
MKTFSETLDSITAFDWEGMAKQPIEYAALAVRQALSALEGSEETVFHNRMRVLRVARHLELWKLDLDPEVDQPFVSMKRWIQTLWPKSYRYCVDAWETEEALDDLPMAELTEVTGANLKVLRQVSSGVRSKGAVLKAAREMTKDRFEAVLTKDYGQHFEKVVLMPPVCVDEWDAVVEMVMLAEDCSRPKAIEKIIDLVKSEYAARYEAAIA